MPESEEVELILGDNDLWVMTEHVFENEPLEEGYDPLDHMF